MTQLEFELDFSHSEKEIAHYILNEGEKVLSLSIKELAKKTRKPVSLRVYSGDPTGNRTRVTAVKGRCLNRLTMGP